MPKKSLKRKVNKVEIYYCYDLDYLILDLIEESLTPAVDKFILFSVK